MSSVFKPAGSKKWVIVYVDEAGRRRKVTGTTDKRVTDMMARDLDNAAELRRRGIVDPRAEAFRDQAARPLDDHLADFRRHLESRGNRSKYVDLRISQAACLAEKAGARRLADLTASRVQAALASMKDGGASHGTCNHYRSSIRGFTRWAWQDGRLREDPLLGVGGFNPEADRRHDRRTIGVDELARLIEAAHSGGPYRGVEGPTRALLYRLAIASGLRWSELASLTPRSFRFLDPPTVTVQAGYAKNGLTATLTLPPDLADDLAAYLAPIDPGAPAFVLPDRGADMLKVDLAAAGIPYRDDAGRVFDFHSLRCQLATLADLAGVSPRVVQRMMRHSTLELTNRYTRPRAVDIDGAVASLPSFRPALERAVRDGTRTGPL